MENIKGDKKMYEQFEENSNGHSVVSKSRVNLYLQVILSNFDMSYYFLNMS